MLSAMSPLPIGVRGTVLPAGETRESVQHGEASLKALSADHDCLWLRILYSFLLLLIWPDVPAWQNRPQSGLHRAAKNVSILQTQFSPEAGPKD